MSIVWCRQCGPFLQFGQDAQMNLFLVKLFELVQTELDQIDQLLKSRDSIKTDQLEKDLKTRYYRIRWLMAAKTYEEIDQALTEFNPIV